MILKTPLSRLWESLVNFVGMIHSVITLAVFDVSENPLQFLILWHYLQEWQNLKVQWNAISKKYKENGTSEVDR